MMNMTNISDLPIDSLAEILGRIDRNESRQKDLTLVCQSWKEILESGRIDCGTNLSRLSLANICKVRHLLGDKKWSTNPIGSCRFSEEFIEYFAEDICWKLLVRCQKLSETIIRHHIEKVRGCLDSILSFHDVSERFIEQFATTEEHWWYLVSERRDLSEEFIERNISHITWEAVSSKKDLSSQFVCKHASRLDWNRMSANYYLSEEIVACAAPYIYDNHVRCFASMPSDLYKKYSSQFKKSDLFATELW